MLELRILVDDIDYDSIAEYLIPAVAEKLRREERAASWETSWPGTRTWRPPWPGRCWGP